MKTKTITLLLALGLPFVTACQKDSSDSSEMASSETEANTETPFYDTDSEDIVDHIHDDFGIAEEIQELGCIRPSSSQVKQVNLGLSKKEKFLKKCYSETKSSSFCSQVARPNPRSVNTFKCTYGSGQTHNLIHPDEKTWQYPIAGIRILQDLQKKGIKITQIYNWWRPEPYNKNVGGAAGRHPYGTSIDVRFASNSQANLAFKELCKMRKAKRLRAIGHYGSASLHIGVGDRTGNTWGKSCGS